MEQENIPELMKRDNITAHTKNIAVAKLIEDLVKTTLGPKGMDKILIDQHGDITVTNDGATILKEINIQHPIGKMMVDVAKTQENEVGDGTTTAVILAGELLIKAKNLIDKNVHPTIILDSYNKANKECQKLINNITLTYEEKDREKKAEEVAMTTLNGKLVEMEKEIIIKKVIESINQIKEQEEIDISNINLICKVGESTNESKLIKGIIMDREKAHPNMPSLIENAKIALLDFGLEFKNPESDSKININNPLELQQFVDMESQIVKDMCDILIKMGVNVVFSTKGIDEVAQQYLARNKIIGVRRVFRDDLLKLSKAIGGTIITDIGSCDKSFLGFAEKVTEEKLSYTKVIKVEGCPNPKSVTLLIRGSTDQMIDETKRAIEDVIGVVANVMKTGKIITGAGATEMYLAHNLKKYASINYKGKEQLSIKAFAEALESIPLILAENAGMDPIDIIADLEKEHENNNIFMGVDVINKGIFDANINKIFEPQKTKTRAIESATEVANMVLRVDDVIAIVKPTQ